MRRGVRPGRAYEGLRPLRPANLEASHRQQCNHQPWAHLAADLVAAAKHGGNRCHAIVPGISVDVLLLYELADAVEELSARLAAEGCEPSSGF